MLKYIKRRRVDEEEDSENKSKLSEPSRSKAEKGVADKKYSFTTTATWPWVLYGLEPKISSFHSALFAGKKLSNTAMVPAELSRHFTTNYREFSNKKMITSNDFWIHRTNNINF
jgi:hypothetical protein